MVMTMTKDNDNVVDNNNNNNSNNSNNNNNNLPIDNQLRIHLPAFFVQVLIALSNYESTLT